MLPHCIPPPNNNNGGFQARKFRELFQNETAYEDGDSLEWVGATVKLTIAEISASLFEIDRAQRGAMGYVMRTWSVAPRRQAVCVLLPAAEKCRMPVLYPVAVGAVGATPFSVRTLLVAAVRAAC